jgi:REP element-mobilizing transposase RayT
MKKQKQFSFFKPQVKFHGGALLYKKRKSLRPLSSKDAIHFVLRSQWAKGSNSFLMTRNRKAIDHIINRFAKKFGVRIYRKSINSNHIHLLLRITNRILYRAFIKAISGRIASHVMGNRSFKLFCAATPRTRASLRTREGDGSKASKTKEGFWQFRPFSRVTNWGKDFNTCMKYLKQNVLEALGFIPYTSRKNFYLKWLNETVPDLKLTKTKAG